MKKTSKKEYLNVIFFKYWNKLKHRLLEEGNESVTNCSQLKLVVVDGKLRESEIGNYFGTNFSYLKIQ
ncbi:MAG: hypothetical protein PHP82_02350 [Candidatus ainarchaeum sp.]|nr:hypothetical protein [Candidatus ainarchaeum sp.]